MFPPGAHFHYSNTNYTLLGLLIGEVTGTSAHAEIRSRILDPLGLEGTFMAWYEDRVVAVPPDGGDPGAAAVTGLGSGAYTAGALASTPADLVRFGEALFGGDLLSPGMLELMVAPGDAVGEGASYGLGAEILEAGGHPVWGHRGGIPGYQSALFYLPESGIVLAVCANSTEPGFPGLRETLIGLVAGGRPARHITPRRPSVDQPRKAPPSRIARSRRSARAKNSGMSRPPVVSGGICSTTLASTRARPAMKVSSSPGSASGHGATCS
jgi:CubicO group peptidase (beta-lactamase class C family)